MSPQLKNPGSTPLKGSGKSGSKSNNENRKNATPKGSRPISSLIRQREAVPSTLNGWYNPTTSEKEVLFTLTDYFDSSASAYQQWLFNLSAGLLGTTADGSDNNILRVKSVKFFALPKFSAETKDGAVLVAFGLPVKNGSSEACSSQQSTLLTPTSVSDWVQVGSWKDSGVFGESVVVPATNSFGDMVLGTLAVLNPDDLTLSSQAVQFRAEIKVAQTIPNVTTATYAVSTSTESDAWFTPDETGTSSQPILASVTGMGNAT